MYRGRRMSQYSRHYCPACDCRTNHEDGFCMVCEEKAADRAERLEAALEDSGIRYDDRVIGRKEEENWTIMILSSIEEEEASPFFQNLPNGDYYKMDMIAPVGGNERIINSKEDAFELWDRERLEGLE